MLHHHHHHHSCCPTPKKKQKTLQLKCSSSAKTIRIDVRQAKQNKLIYSIVPDTNNDPSLSLSCGRCRCRHTQKQFFKYMDEEVADQHNHFRFLLDVFVANRVLIQFFFSRLR